MTQDGAQVLYHPELQHLRPDHGTVVVAGRHHLCPEVHLRHGEKRHPRRPADLLTTGMETVQLLPYDALGRLTGVGGKTGRSYAYADRADGATTQIA